MATSLEFGSLSTSGTTPRLSGTSSQLDTESLIEALTEAKRLPALRLENQITENESRLAAFTDLRALLSEVQASVAGGRNPPGVLGQDDNIFENKEAFFTSSSSVSPTELLGVSASNQAATGSYEITVEQLATTRKFSSAATTAADQTLADAFNAGAAFNQTITIGLAGSGSNASIDVDGSMDIYELSAAINAQSADAGVQASVLKVSDSDFRLVVTATTTGTEVTLGGDAATLDLLGFSADGGASFENSLQIPELAQLEIDNVTITRSTNQITDAIDGLTFNLFKADLGTTVKVDVEPALNDVKSTVTRFVDAYNEFRSFVEQQSAISETGEISEDSILFGNSTLRALERVVTDNVGTGVDGLDVDALRSLSAIGINLDAGNKLSIDEAKFDDLLLNDLDSVRDVLEFRFTSSSTDLEVFSRGNTLGDTDFTVD
ncbi:MAG: flagellar filament capping protein FliD, partial [Pseudomonadota bacterium]